MTKMASPGGWPVLGRGVAQVLVCSWAPVPGPGARAATGAASLPLGTGGCRNKSSINVTRERKAEPQDG